MINVPNSIISKFLFFVTFICLGVGVFLYLKPHKTSKSTFSGEDFAQVIEQVLPQVSQRWIEADKEGFFEKGLFNCPELISNKMNLGGNYFKCNSLYMECFFQKGAGNKETYFPAKLQDKIYKVYPRKQKSSFVSPMTTKKYQVEFSIEGEKSSSFSVVLEDVCKDTFLPENIYSEGSNKEDSEKWDNFGRKIYIDKNYVTNLDTDIWRKLQGKKMKYGPKKWPKPSTELNLSERIKYCQFMGKQLLQSHILDAASFIPNKNSVKQKFIYKPAYPWTKNTRKSFLFKAKKNDSFKVTEKHCDRAYIKECNTLKPYKFFETNTATWIGLYSTLGGYMESVDNKFDLKKSLKPSSFYFSAKSIWHEIGKRAYWSGDGFGHSSFHFHWNFDDSNTIEPDQKSDLKVAFRCMVEK